VAKKHIPPHIGGKRQAPPRPSLFLSWRYKGPLESKEEKIPKRPVEEISAEQRRIKEQRRRDYEERFERRMPAILDRHDGV
jgi:hypothetical protein